MDMCPLGASTLSKFFSPFLQDQDQENTFKKKKILSFRYYTYYLPVISDVISVV
jgi:hypothetical protein